MTLAWDHDGGQDIYYKVYEKIDGEWILLGTTTEKSYNIGNPAPGVHTYVTTAHDGRLESALGNELIVTIPENMSLINLSTPVTQPAVPEKQYTAAYVTTMILHFTSATEGKITLKLSPFDPDSNSIKPGGHTETVTTDHLMEFIAENAEAQQVFALIVSLVPQVRAWEAARIAALEAEE
jgi:hypothetical protein